jgi:hypothetical protein
MSYDIYLRSKVCEHCGQSKPEPYLPEPTYNLTAIFDLALTGEALPNENVSEMEVVLFKKETDRPRGLRLLSGRKARDTIGLLTKALAHLRNPAERETFVSLEPPNKWGTLESAIEVMDRLLQAAMENPENTWEVH